MPIRLYCGRTGNGSCMGTKALSEVQKDLSSLAVETVRVDGERGAIPQVEEWK